MPGLHIQYNGMCIQKDKPMDIGVESKFIDQIRLRPLSTDSGCTILIFRLDINCSTSCRQIEQLRRCEVIKESEVKALCAKARYEILHTVVST